MYGESSGMRSKYIRSPGQGQMFGVDDKGPGREKKVMGQLGTRKYGRILRDLVA